MVGPKLKHAVYLQPGAEKMLPQPNSPPCKLEILPACTYHIGSSLKKHYTARDENPGGIHSVFCKEIQA